MNQKIKPQDTKKQRHLTFLYATAKREYLIYFGKISGIGYL